MTNAENALLPAIRESRELVLLADDAGRIVYANPRAAEVLGIDVGAEATRTLESLHTDDSRRDVWREAERALAARGQWIGTVTLRDAAGQMLPACQSVRILSDDEGPRYSATIRPLEMHCAAVESLRRSEERYKLLVNELDVGVLVQGPNAEILHSNPKALELLGLTLDHLLGRTSFDPSWNVIREDGFDFPGPTHPVPTSIRTKAPVRNVVMGVYRPASEDRVWLLVNAEPQLDEEGAVAQVLCTFTDITEHRRLQEAVRNTQRVDSVARLTAGVAHDFNNLLTLVMGHAELAMDTASKEGREELEQLVQATSMAASLTRRLMSFGRTTGGQPRPVGVHELLKEVAPLFRRALGGGVDLVVDASPEVVPVLIDPGQLEQILLNLVLNARDAMPEGGTITIRIQCAADRKGFVELCVRDTGTGIAPEHRGRVFEPFFTTKAERRGTGLGLASAKDLVEAAGGEISFRSEPGQGTTFTVLLPEAAETLEPERMSDADAATTRGARVLVLEDDAFVRRMAVRVLEGVGCEVFSAEDARSAIEVAGAEQLDVVVSDVVLPGASGPEAVEAILKLQPHVKSCFVSGYAPKDLLERGLAATDASLLAKPYTPTALVRAVRRALA